MGPCAGGAVYSPALTDFIFMVEQTSQMFLTCPDVIASVKGEITTVEELRGAASPVSHSGVAKLSSPNETECLEEWQRLLSYLHTHNMDHQPFEEPGQPVR